MRLGIVIYGRLTQQTGGYLYDRMLVAGLRRLGDEVEVIELPERGAIGRLLHNARPAGQRRGAFDVILQDELCHPSLWAANARAGACPRVAIVHNLGGEGRLGRWLERRYLRSVDGVIANSAHTLKAVEAAIGGAPPCVIAQPALEHQRPALEDPVTSAEIAARDHDGVRLLLVGNLSPVKGLHLLLPALARLRHRRWTLRVVGSLERDTAYVRRCRRQIVALDLEARVDLGGALSGPELARVYRASDLVVSTSPEEGFGLVYLEGMAFGLPVVASDRGAAPEIMTDGREARLVAPENLPRLTAALAEMITNRDQRVALGQAALARAAAYPHQNWLQTAQVVRGFIMGLAGRAVGVRCVERWRRTDEQTS